MCPLLPRSRHPAAGRNQPACAQTTDLHAGGGACRVCRVYAVLIGGCAVPVAASYVLTVCTAVLRPTPTAVTPIYAIAYICYRLYRLTPYRVPPARGGLRNRAHINFSHLSPAHCESLRVRPSLCRYVSDSCLEKQLVIRRNPQSHTHVHAPTLGEGERHTLTHLWGWGRVCALSQYNCRSTTRHRLPCAD